MSASTLPDPLHSLHAAQQPQREASAADACLNDVARMAAGICGSPMAGVAVVDAQSLACRAHLGLTADQASLAVSFCALAMTRPDSVTVIPDALGDERLSRHALVREEARARFFAGVPLLSRDGRVLGTVFALDSEPRRLSARQLELLRLLGRQSGGVWSAFQAQERADSERQMHTVAAATHALDLLALIDRNYVYRHVNERYLTYWGTTRDAVEGRSVSALVGRSAFEDNIKPLLDRALAGQTVDYSREIDFPGMGRRFVSVTLVPAVVEGEITGVVVRGHDMQELRRVQTELELALQELTVKNLRQQQFIQMMSHDFREPVNTLVNFSGLLQEDLAGAAQSPEHARFLSFIHDSSLRMRAMLDDLLSFVRLDAGSPHLVPVDLKLLVQQVQDDLSDAAQRASARLELRVEGTVLGVESQLRVLLQNLLSNAMKFRKPGEPAQVLVESRRNGSRIDVVVSDQGIGIPESHRAKLFLPFNRHMPERLYPGTGLGLAICRRIVELHLGEIFVHSREGEGTQVEVSLACPPDGPGGAR